ncbi:MULTISPECIES: NADH-quinone oxidoreductase subunit NuoN [Pseudoxanthomonas]|uniref:NADH-quinone oxidoreductase subunit NuoN n=1 Tax=Pseudoxanthomonas TaxID=83618 RepID=UPI001622870F|nr:MULTISPECIES: NADH-quinone oxidoreductase subunit NuoN [Pseudoxanthomonas]MBD9376524.1 NADH-quinone oxidoreductase subunit NuoN [Pseudoxanthomonas sp. PXM04]MBV7475544.1 NADH-quinone oxidoreductase subunit NuoN [Pseudoxanthomonas sp. PXM05]UBB26482.1 NADH-quinone oxidoreductase subunit NuoN [Pseudoxanthomonas japonensis]
MMTTSMLPTAADLLPLLPEVVLIAGAFALLMLDLFLSDRQRVITHLLALATLAVSFFMILGDVGGSGAVFNGMFVRDVMANVTKLAILLVSGLSLVYAWPYLRERKLYPGEVPVLVMLATAGMMMMVSAGSLVMVYLGLELLALCSYALVALNREDGLSAEAAMKYIVLGSLASGLLLYGMSLVYGATGTLHLDGIHAAIAGATDRTLLLTGVVFMVAGVAFKLGAAPFHMWLPDVYQGAPTPITLFISSGPKLAAFGMAYRLLESGVGPVNEQWQWLLAGLAAASLVIGNLIAIAQTNLKRMLAYSTVSHVGFLLVGFAGGGATGYSAALFYAISYALMSAAAFGAIVVLSRQGFEADKIDDFKGLNARNPWQAGLVLCVMASLAGVPPFLGFWAKLVVLGAALKGGFTWLAILGVVCAVIGAFYYLRVIKVMYFDEPVGERQPARQDRVVPVVFGVNALALLVLGIFWNPIMAWCQQAFAG